MAEPALVIGHQRLEDELADGVARFADDPVGPPVDSELLSQGQVLKDECTPASEE